MNSFPKELLKNQTGSKQKADKQRKPRAHTLRIKCMNCKPWVFSRGAALSCYRLHTSPSKTLESSRTKEPAFFNSKDQDHYS